MDVKRNPNRELHECPLSRLKYVRCRSWSEHPSGLESIALYIALSSVCWFETERNEETGFDWPEHLPCSNVREILLERSSIAKNTIERFAMEALRGPCVIRQSWGVRRLGKMPDQVYRLEIPYRDATKEEIIIEMVEDKVLKAINEEGATEYMGWEVKPKGTRRQMFDDGVFRVTISHGKRIKRKTKANIKTYNRRDSLVVTG
ncbi:hypothetical protein F5884DRAFT_795154 [Xylogone sp. PMI_703]|nr:hypothetical protein F5884DRAFT_795154 [Xylogone sp. PMI_703]